MFAYSDSAGGAFPDAYRFSSHSSLYGFLTREFISHFDDPRLPSIEIRKTISEEEFLGQLNQIFPNPIKKDEIPLLRQEFDSKLRRFRKMLGPAA